MAHQSSRGEPVMGEIMTMTVGVMMIAAPPPSKQTCSPQIVPVIMLEFVLPVV